MLAADRYRARPAFFRIALVFLSDQTVWPCTRSTRGRRGAMAHLLGKMGSFYLGRRDAGQQPAVPEKSQEGAVTDSQDCSRSRGDETQPEPRASPSASPGIVVVCSEWDGTDHPRPFSLRRLCTFMGPVSLLPPSALLHVV